MFATSTGTGGGAPRLTKVINGTYQGKSVTHYLNPGNGLNVMKDASGNFISGWKLNSTQQANVMFRGSL
jgi:hypothetical protein